MHGPDGQSLARRHVELYEVRSPTEVTNGRAATAVALCDIGTKGVSVSSTQDTVLWLQVAVPSDATPGIYTGALEFSADGTPCGHFPFTVHVHDVLLPNPSDWSLGLEVWQPWSLLGRSQGLTLFTEPWWGTAEAYMMALATLGVQSSQVGRAFCDWRRVADGQWQFDFTRLDRFRRLCHDCGIDGPTSYLGMFGTVEPTQVHYFDEAGELQTVTAEPGEKMFDDAWAAFGEALARHWRHVASPSDIYVWPTDRPAEAEDVGRFAHAAGLLRSHSPDCRIGVTVDSAATALELADQVDRMALPLQGLTEPSPKAVDELRSMGKTVWGFLDLGDDGPGIQSGLPAVYSYAAGPLAYYLGLDGIVVSSSFGDVIVDGTQDSDTTGDMQEQSATTSLFHVGEQVRMSLAAERLFLGLQDAQLLRMAGHEHTEQWFSEYSLQEDWRRLSQCADRLLQRALTSITTNRQ